MNKKITTLFMTMILSSLMIAQPPQAFKYQAVVRDATGEIISNQSIGVRITIHDDLIGGPVIYQETHTVSTNQFGLITLNIGWGIPGGGYIFEDIDWGFLQKFIEMEIDPTGGGVYTSLGTSQLLSVPYALFAEGSSDWLRNGFDLYNSNFGNIGIGTSTPNAKLDVLGSLDMAIIGYSVNNYAINGKSEGSGVAGVLGQGLTADTWGVYGYNAFGGVAVRGYSDGGWGGYFVGDLYVSDRIGLRTTNPDYPLHVKDHHEDWLVGFHNESWDANGNGLVVRAEGGDPFLAQAFWGDVFIIKNSGKVGIGTSTPDAKLHVNDRILVGEDPSYPTVFGELIHEGAGTGFKINAHAGGGSWADMHLQTNGTTKMFIESSGKVGIGTTSPIRLLQVSSTGSLDAIQGWSPDGTGVYAVSASSYGVFGQSTSGYAGYFSGPVHVTGYLSKGSGSFVIDHPLDPENQLLRHNFVESPENLLIYRGKIKLNSVGEITVELPDYFEVLTMESEATVILTSVGKPFLTGYEWNADFAAFKIFGESEREVSWVVYADRDDPVIHELGRPVEEEKGGENTLCEKGRLLYPEAYGYPESMGRDYKMKKLALENK